MSEAKEQQAPEMVERVAKAISGIAHWDDLFDFAKEPYREVARAAIAAMRDPTKAMAEAACDAIEKYEDEVRGGDLTPTRHCLPETVWRAMINEAVK